MYRNNTYKQNSNTTRIDKRTEYEHTLTPIIRAMNKSSLVYRDMNKSTYIHVLVVARPKVRKSVTPIPYTPSILINRGTGVFYLAV